MLVPSYSSWSEGKKSPVEKATGSTPVPSFNDWSKARGSTIPEAPAPVIPKDSRTTGSNIAELFTLGIGNFGGRIVDQGFKVANSFVGMAERKIDKKIGTLEKVGLDGSPLSKVKDFDLEKKLEGYRTGLKQNLERGTEVLRERNPMSDTFAGQTSEIFGAMVPTVALAVAKVPQLALALSEAVMNAEDSYTNNIESGMGRREAIKRAMPQLSADLAVTYVTNKLGTLGKFSGEGKNFFKSRIVETLKDTILELIQEIWQTGSQNLAEGNPFTQNMTETAKLAFLPSIIFGAAGTIQPRDPAEIKQQVASTIETINKKIEEGKTLTEEESVVLAVTDGVNPFIESVPDIVEGIPPMPTYQATLDNLEQKVGGTSEIKSMEESFDQFTNRIDDIIDEDLTTEKIEEINQEIFELSFELALREEIIKDNPYRQLSKYANRNGELPEVTANRKSKFGRKGDEIVTEILGDVDSEGAREGYQQYLVIKKELENDKKYLKSLKEKLATFKVKKPKTETIVSDAVASEETTPAQKAVKDGLTEDEFVKGQLEGSIGVDFDRISKQVNQNYSDAFGVDVAKKNTDRFMSNLFSDKTKFASMVQVDQPIGRQIFENLFKVTLPKGKKATTEFIDEFLSNNKYLTGKTISELRTEFADAQKASETPKAITGDARPATAQATKKLDEANAGEEFDATQIVAPEIVEDTAPKDRGVSKTAKRIADNLVENNVPVDFQNLAEFDKITIKEGFEKASEIINDDIEIASKMLEGVILLPQGFKGQFLVEKMREYLIKNPNADLSYILLNSPLLTEVSQAAQTMRVAREIQADSAIGKAMAIKKTREARLGEPKMARAKKNIKKIIDSTKEVNLSADELKWDNFLESITC